MLSRGADALLWMSRYVERADHLARLLDVSFHLELDLHGVARAADASSPEEELIRQVLAIFLLQPPEGLPVTEENSQAIQHWLAFDTDNPQSILTCVNRARNNARSIR